MPFSLDYAFQILVALLKLHDEKGRSFLCGLVFCSFYHLLRVASRNKEGFQIFNILFSVNFTVSLTHVRELIGSSVSNHGTYFAVIQTYIFHLSTLPKSIFDKKTAGRR